MDSGEYYDLCAKIEQEASQGLRHTCEYCAHRIAIKGELLCAVCARSVEPRTLRLNPNRRQGLKR